jgi:hypothetical protein
MVWYGMVWYGMVWAVQALYECRMGPRREYGAQQDGCPASLGTRIALVGLVLVVVPNSSSSGAALHWGTVISTLSPDFAATPAAAAPGSGGAGESRAQPPKVSMEKSLVSGVGRFRWTCCSIPLNWLVVTTPRGRCDYKSLHQRSA